MERDLEQGCQLNEAEVWKANQRLELA